MGGRWVLERSEMTDLEKVVVEALKSAKAIWDEAFVVKGYGERFDKYSVAPEPLAIVEIAKVLIIQGLADRQ